ncbi:MAG: Ig-like domain-containing protein, partial [Gemmatimonadales bacterium]
PNVTYTATGGLISAQGLFVAGQFPGIYQVIARQVGGTLVDTATISLVVPGTVLTQVNISPRLPSLAAGQSLQFSVTGQMSDGSTIIPQVTWTGTGGAINAGGLYTAGITLGRFQVVATGLDQVVGTVADSTLVTITAPPPGGGNLVNMTFESGAFEGLSDGNGGLPLNGEIVSGGCFSGIYCFDVNLVGATTDQEGSGYWVGGQQYADLWISFALKVITPPASGVATQEMVIFRNGVDKFGELNEVGGQWAWNWLLTNPASGNITLNPLGTVAGGAGQWHTYKLHLQSHATTSVAIGKDGVDNLVVLSIPAAAPGIPTTLTLGGALVGGSGPSHFLVDDVHIGTVDPGWP